MLPPLDVPPSRRRATDVTSEPISFCLVTTFYPPASFGGDAVQVRRLAQGLAGRGHRVRVVHSPAAHRLLGGKASPPDQDGPPGVEVVAAPGGPLPRAATAGTYLTGGPLGYRRRLGDLVRGFDVVHFHNPSLLGGPSSLSLGDADAVRLYTTHEHWLLCPTHVLFRYGREVCTKRTCFSCTLSYGRPPQPWRATDLLARGVGRLDALLAPSRFTADLHRAAFPRARIEVIPLFSAGDVADGPALDPPPSRPYFLFAGRLEPIKGADRLVRAFAGVRGAELLVAGSGSQEDELRAVASANPAVRLLGHLPHGQVLSLAAGALAVVVPSAGYETFGGVAVDAMAFGTPAVVRNLGPLPELVEDGGGVVFDDDEGLVRRLQALVDDPREARRMRAEAAEVAERRFSDHRFFCIYLELLADVASGRRLHGLAARAARAAETANGEAR